MNIVHVVENLNRGGLERMVIDLVTMQQRQGHACRVVCLFEAGALAHELAEQGVPVLACGELRDDPEPIDAGAAPCAACTLHYGLAGARQ